MKIKGSTNIVGLIGHPVEHSFSPPMHKPCAVVASSRIRPERIHADGHGFLFPAMLFLPERAENSPSSLPHAHAFSRASAFFAKTTLTTRRICSILREYNSPKTNIALELHLT